jgi:hypothetical protein
MGKYLSGEPVVADRNEQPYVGISGLVSMQRISEMADRIPVLFGWLAERGIAPAGPPFLRYNVIDMERELEITSRDTTPRLAEHTTSL